MANPLDDLPTPPGSVTVSELPAPPDSPGSELVRSFTPGTPVKGAAVVDLPAPPDTELPPPSHSTELGTAESIEKELKDRSVFDRPAIGSETTTDAEIAAIANKHGVSLEALEALAPYFGARREGKDGDLVEGAKRVIGGVGSAFLGAPQKLAKLSETPQMERALDDLQELAGGRTSYAQLGTEVIAPIGGVAKAGAGVLNKVLTGAGIGVAGGVAGSRQDKELEGAVIGGTLGGVIGGVTHAITSKLASRAASKVEKEAIEDVARTAGPDIDKGIDDVLATRSSSEKDIEAYVLGKGADLDDDVAAKVVRDRVSPDTIRALEESPETLELYIRRANKEMPETLRDFGEGKTIQRILAQDALERETIDFAESLGEKSINEISAAREAIAKYSYAQGGDEALQMRYAGFQREQAAKEYLAQSHIRPGTEAHFGRKALDMVSDGQFVMRDIDNRTGAGLEPIHRELSKQTNRMSYPRQMFRKDLDSIYRDAKKSGIDEVVTDTDKIYQAIDKGDYSGLSKEEADTADKFRAYFRKGLDFVNGAVRELKGDKSITPLSIPARSNYVPYQIKPPRELETIIKGKIEKTGLDLAELGETPTFKKALGSSEDLREVADGIARLDENGPVTSGPELLARIHDLLTTREGREAIETQARAALERTDNPLPEWMREKNLYKLADSWSSSTLKHLYMRKPIEDMASKMRILRKSGAEVEATYVQNLLADLQGSRAGTAGAYASSIGDKYHQSIDKLLGASPEGIAKAAAGIAKALPDMLQDINKQIYPNLLGLNPKAILMNATQPIAKTLPEIGLTPYGGVALARGAALALKNFGKYSERVVEEGLQPAEFVGKYRRAISDGIARSSLWAIPNETLAKMGEAALYLYGKMDMLNRSITAATSEVIIHDIQSGSKKALRVLDRLPPTVSSAIRKAGSPEEATEILTSHLNASTQYNYNRASMSEFGRTMGPFFSTFTKWPTATAGEMISEWRKGGMTKGTLRNMEKFLAPLLLFKAADAVIGHTAGDREGNLTPRQQYFLGKGGIASSSPIGAAGAIVSGDFFTPPAVDALIKGVLEPAKKGDMAKLRSGVASAVQNFTPGSVYVRFLTDDLITLIKGARPEGSNFFDRTADGARQLNKLGK